MKSTHSIHSHVDQLHADQNKIDESPLNIQNLTTPFNQHNQCQPKTEAVHWGKISPYLFDKSTKIPLVTITHKFNSALALNLLIIILFCVLFPLVLEQSLRTSIKFQVIPDRSLQAESDTVIYVQHPLLQKQSQLAENNITWFIQYYNLAYILVWTLFQVVTLLILLLSNPGYHQNHPCSSNYSQVAHSQQNPSKDNEEDESIEGRKCCICKSIVDNSVHHCEACDLCCQGFSHHCEWIGKCIGKRNFVVFRLYTIGFFVGITVNSLSQLTFLQI